MKSQFSFQFSFGAVVLLTRITSKPSQMMPHNEVRDISMAGLVRVGVVLVAGESAISRKVDNGVFTLFASSKLRFDLHQPDIP